MKDKARLDEVRQGKAEQSKVRFKARQSKVKFKARQCKGRQGKARRDDEERSKSSAALS